MATTSRCQRLLNRGDDILLRGCSTCLYTCRHKELKDYVFGKVIGSRIQQRHDLLRRLHLLHGQSSRKCQPHLFSCAICCVHHLLLRHVPFCRQNWTSRLAGLGRGRYGVLSLRCRGTLRAHYEHVPGMSTFFALSQE
jgi:hypothetical protein